MLAEEQTAKAVWFVTLTYAGGYENNQAYIIEYGHVQKMFKRLRRAGHRFKYVAVGEHGTSAERAHFHLLLYWETEPPACEMDTNWQWKFWPHGHTNVQKPRSQQGAAVYLMDYMNKDALERAVMKYSKNPMLGQEYLLAYAEEHAEKGVALFADSDRFIIPHNLNKDGKPFYYPVGQDTAMFSKMIDAYLSRWAACRPDQRLHLSEIVGEYLGDLFQDTSSLAPHVQQYVSRHYGYDPVEPEIPFAVETTYSLPNLTVIHRGATLRVEILNSKGEIIWQACDNDANVRNEPGAKKLFRKHLSELLQNAPPRAQKILNTIPSLTTLIGSWKASQGIPNSTLNSMTLIGSRVPSLQKKLQPPERIDVLERRANQNPNKYPIPP